MKKFNKMLSVVLSLVLCASLVAPALAVEYDIANGNVYVESDDKGVYSYQGTKTDGGISRDTDITVTGTSNTNTITVGENVETNITLDNANIGGTINVKSSALSIGKDSDVTVNLKGNNTLEGYGGKAGLELNNSSVTIVGTGTEEGDATLKVTGNDGNGENGASGIGGDNIGSGNITVRNSIVNAVGTGAGAAIGGGTGEMKGNITITGSKVTAIGAVITDGDEVIGGGAGIGGGTGEMKGNITIENSNIVGAHGGGGSSAAGIGAGSGGMSGNITINNSTATEWGGDSIRGGDKGAGIGGTTGNIEINGGELEVTGGASGIGGRNGEAGNITIQNGAVVEAGVRNDGGALGGTGIRGGKGNITITDSTVTATGGKSGAGIGNGWGMEGGIAITNSTVTATGNGAAGIGGGGGGQVKGNIVISGGNVTAKANANSDPGIGAGGNGNPMGSKIVITDGAVVTAIGGGYSVAAIGRNEGTMAGEIEISADSTVLALNNGTEPAITKNSGDGYVLNGQFNANYFANSVQGGSSVFYLVDENGTEIEFNVSFDGKLYNSFGIRLPAGSYTLKDAAGNYVGYGEDGRIVIYTVGEDNKLVTDTNLQAVTNSVKYEFAGEDLPEEVTALLTEEVNAETTFDPVRVAGGQWVFQNDWTLTQDEIDEDGKLQDIVYTGSWAFVADRPVIGDPADEVEIDDVEVPLAGLFTRADAIGYLWEQSGSPEWELSDFEDVPEDHQWAVAIGWAQDMGIAVADEDGNFRPDDLVLRSVEDLEIDPEGELQEFLNRYAVYAGIELEPGELFIELDGAWDDIIMGEEAQVIFDNFFAKLELALAQAA